MNAPFKTAAARSLAAGLLCAAPAAAGPPPAPMPAASMPAAPPVCTNPDCPVHGCPPAVRVAPRRPGLLDRWRRRRDEASEIGPPYHSDFAFQPPPLGALMHATMQEQVDNGERALLVVHRIDFAPGSAEPNAGGLRRLAAIAAKLPRSALPVIVEPPRATDEGAAELAGARRARVAELLAGGPFPVPPERVVVGPDLAAGLAGADAELVYRNLLILTGSGGQLRTRFDVFGGAAQGPTSPTAAGATPAGPAR